MVLEDMEDTLTLMSRPVDRDSVLVFSVRMSHKRMHLLIHLPCKHLQSNALKLVRWNVSTTRSRQQT